MLNQSGLSEILPLNDITIKFLSNNTVQVLHEGDLGKKTKIITFDEFVSSILAAKDESDVQTSVDTPVLPVTKNIGTLQHRKLSSGSEIIILVRDAGQFDINYFGDMFKNCGIPKLLFAIKKLNNVIQAVFVAAVKDYIVSEESKIFCYPFSNAGYTSSGKICYGANRISQIDIQSTVMLHSVPDMFLSMENNNDAYGQNLSGLQYRPLLENLIDKPFNEDWLKPMGESNKGVDYKTWVGSL